MMSDCMTNYYFKASYAEVVTLHITFYKVFLDSGNDVAAGDKTKRLIYI